MLYFNHGKGERMKQYKGYLVRIKNDWYSVKSITKNMTSNIYHYELEYLNFANFKINFDPMYLNLSHAKNLANQMNALSKRLYGNHCVSFYGINDNLTTLELI